MAFFHPQEPFQPHHDHSHSASSSTVDDDLDVETASLIAKLALDDLADLMGSRKGKARADSLPSDVRSMAFHRGGHQTRQKH